MLTLQTAYPDRLVFDLLSASEFGFGTAEMDASECQVAEVLMIEVIDKFTVCLLKCAGQATALPQSAALLRPMPWLDPSLQFWKVRCFAINAVVTNEPAVKPYAISAFLKTRKVIKPSGGSTLCSSTESAGSCRTVSIAKSECQPIVFAIGANARSRNARIPRWR